MSFPTHRDALASELVATIEGYVRRHGLSFDRGAVQDFSVSVTQLATEALILGAELEPSARRDHVG